MAAADQFMSSLADDQASPSGIQTGMSAKQRLAQAMRLASDDNTEVEGPEAGSRFSTNVVGVPNPYGTGIKAFEPNTVIGSAYAQAKQVSDQSKLAEAAQQASTSTVTVGGTEAGGSAPLGNATGKVAQAISAAMGLAARKVPYVWGGTTSNGVDCSGMLYYAFKSAGIDTKRYRAVDYGHMGQAVSVQDARPGDVIYYDEAGDTDHVGLYIGNGQMVQAPTTGDVVKVSSIGKPTSIRRIFTDDAFDTVASPGGTAQTSYGGLIYQPWLTGIVPQPTGSTITRPAPAGVGRSRAL